MQKGDSTIIKTYILEPGQELTADQIAEVEEAKKRPITFDEDCPELSPAVIKAFECLIKQLNRREKS